MAGAAVFGFADSFGSGDGESTVGAAVVDGVGCRSVDGEWEMDLRGLGHLRDCDRLGRDTAHCETE